jgi:hypothetical protein
MHLLMGPEESGRYLRAQALETMHINFLESVDSDQPQMFAFVDGVSDDVSSTHQMEVRVAIATAGQPWEAYRLGQARIAFRYATTAEFANGPPRGRVRQG